MRRLITVFVFSFWFSNAFAVDFGIGVDLNENGKTAFFPIEMTNSFRLEPGVRYAKEELDNVSTETLTLSLGLLKKAALSNNVRSYYGARLYYFESEVKSPVFTNSDSDSYGIAPLIGMEYSFSDRFSLSAEAQWQYSKSDSGTNQSDFTTKSTNTAIIARFFY